MQLPPRFCRTLVATFPTQARHRNLRTSRPGLRVPLAVVAAAGLVTVALPAISAFSGVSTRVGATTQTPAAAPQPAFQALSCSAPTIYNVTSIGKLLRAQLHRPWPTRAAAPSRHRREQHLRQRRGNVRRRAHRVLGEQDADGGATRRSTSRTSPRARNTNFTEPDGQRREHAHRRRRQPDQRLLLLRGLELGGHHSSTSSPSTRRRTPPPRPAPSRRRPASRTPTAT